MTVTIEQFGDRDLQTSTYAALPLESLWTRAGGPVVVQAPGMWPRHIRTNAQAKNVTVEIAILAGEVNDARRELMEWFPIGQTGELLVDDDGTRKVLDCTVIQTNPFARGQAVFGVTLQAADPRWRGADVTTASASIAASGTSVTATNPGNTTDDAPVITITPRTAKAATSGYLYRVRSIVAWRATRESGNYAIELTENWDHAAEVSASRSQSDGDDVRVLVDGLEVPRWFGEHADHDANDNETNVWINASFQPRKTAVTVAAITAVSPATDGDLEVTRGGTAGWPREGVILIEDEVILYSGITRANSNGREAFTGITRAAWNTTAAAHSASTTMYWVEHEIEIVYGHTGVSAPDARGDLKPLLDLTSTTTSNLRHEWLNFADDTYPGRSMQWGRRIRSNDDQADKILAPGGSPAANMTFEYQSNGASSGKPNFNAWYRDFPTGTGSSGGNVISWTRALADTLGLDVIGIDDSGAEISLARYNGALASGSANVTAPTNSVYRVECQAYNQVVARRPDGPAYTGTFNLDATNGNFGQQFTTGDEALELVGATVQITGTAADVITAHFEADGSVADAPSGTDFVSDTTVAAGGAEHIVHDFTPFTLQPNREYWICWDDGAGGTSLIRYGDLGYTGGVARLSGSNRNYQCTNFRILGRKAATATNLTRCDDNCLGDDGDQVTLDAVTVHLSSTETPYVALKSRESVYRLQGTLYNETTGQQITLDCVTELNAPIEIYVDQAYTQDAMAGRSLPGVVFSDPESKFVLAPGANTIRFVESGVAGVDVSLDYYGRWE